MKSQQKTPSREEGLKTKPFCSKLPQPRFGIFFQSSFRQESGSCKSPKVRPYRWRRQRQNKILFLAVVVIMVFIAMTNFAFRFQAMDQTDVKVAAFKRTINNLRAAAVVDSTRQFQIQKIMTIIDRYNPTMPSEKKYVIADEIYKMTIKYPNLNVDLICATITHETALTWRPDVKSPVGAIGLMQIMPTTGAILAADEGICWTKPEEVLRDPILNIRLGCRYLSMLISQYELDGGLAAYNGGEKRAAMWLASGRNNKVLWEETRGYVPAILKLYEKFQN